jgi:hypothetical protein
VSDQSQFEVFRALVHHRLAEVRASLPKAKGTIQFLAPDESRAFVVSLDGPASRSFIGEVVRPDALVELSSANVASMFRGSNADIPVYGDFTLVLTLIESIQQAAPAGSWLDLVASKGARS